MADLDRRRWLGSALAGSLLALNIPLAHATSILGVRVWPARDYTRVTLELDAALKFAHFTIADPDRLVLDLEGIELDDALRQIVAKIEPNDPFITLVRVGQFKPRVVRLVFDLKQQIEPQVFTLAPIASYKHRLVVDLHPLRPVDPLSTLPPVAAAPLPPPAARAPAAPPAHDPLSALIREREGALETPSRSKLPPLARAPERPAPPAVARLLTVAIDPGHGGEDPGAIGRRGTREKDVVLAIAQRLRERIAAEPNMRAFLTRDSDYFVPLATRVEKARRVQADLFVSIHADAFVRPQARGSSVFVLSDNGASSVGARWLARRENRSDLIGGVNLASRNREVAKLLLELSTTAQINSSRRLASAMLGELKNVGALHKAQVEQAGFAVLRAPDIPSVLVETAFISNPEEERKLRDPRYQDQVAAAIFNGIRKYFAKNPPGPKAVPL